MGSTKLWLPSRKSVESHRGGLSRVLLGHCRSSSLRGGKRLYFFEGSLSLYSKHQHFNSQDPEAQRVPYIGMLTYGGVVFRNFIAWSMAVAFSDPCGVVQVRPKVFECNKEFWQKRIQYLFEIGS